MGILCARRGDDPDVRRFRMRQKQASISDDFWLEDVSGAVVALESFTG